MGVMEDSVLTATEVMVPDMALFLPLAHPLLLEPMPPQPPLPPSLFAATAPPPLLEPTSPTAMLPPATTGLTLLELSTLPRGLLSLLRPRLRTRIWVRRIRRPYRHWSLDCLSCWLPPPRICSGIRLRPRLWLWPLITTSAMV